MAAPHFTAGDKLAEVKRELAMRRRVYPGLIAKGSLAQEQADIRIAMMEAIAADYREQAERERLL